jgi:hypothetical protein
MGACSGKPGEECEQRATRSKQPFDYDKFERDLLAEIYESRPVYGPSSNNETEKIGENIAVLVKEGEKARKNSEEKRLRRERSFGGGNKYKKRKKDKTKKKKIKKRKKTKKKKTKTKKNKYKRM